MTKEDKNRVAEEILKIINCLCKDNVCSVTVPRAAVEECLFAIPDTCKKVELIFDLEDLSDVKTSVYTHIKFVNVIKTIKLTTQVLFLSDLKAILKNIEEGKND